MAISFNNIPSNLRVPLFYAEVDNSLANTGSNDLKALLIGQMTSEGKAEAGKPVLVTGDSAGKELFGRGSQLARMNSAYRDNDTAGEVWAIPVAAASGASKASATVTLSGEATAAGTVYLYVAGVRVSANAAIGDAAAEIASALADAVNAKRDLPVDAEASGTVVTLSAKCAGLAGNDIPVTLNYAGYASGEELPEGISAAVTVMAGGAGTPDLDAVAAAMGSEEYDFIAMPYADSASIAVFTKLMNDTAGRWSPTSQLYGHVYTAKRGTVAALQAFGSALNDQHLTVVGVEQDAQNEAVEILGATVARCAKAAIADPARPQQTLELIGITPTAVGSRWTLSEKQTLLHNGIATTYVSGGYQRTERMITTYQTNSFGDADTSYLDSETLHTLAYIIRSLKSVITSKYPRHKLADGGTNYGPGQAIVTPSVIRGELVAQYQRLETKGIVENLDLFKENLIVERNADDPNRLDVLLPPDLVNGLRVFAMLAQFRLQY